MTSSRSYSVATPVFLSFMIIVSIILILDFASSAHLGCAPGYGCSYAYNPTDDNNIYHTRKMLMGLMGSSITGAVPDQEREKEKGSYEDELRNVPSGPDPLHHKKRPRISP